MKTDKSTFGFFNSYSLWGGGEKWNIEMMEKLGENGHSCTLFSPQNGELSKRVKERQLGSVIDSSITKYSYFNPLHFNRYVKLFKKNPVDVLIFNSFVDARAAALAAKVAGIKKVIMRVGTPIAPKEKLSYRAAFKYGLDEVVVISEEIKRVFQNDAPKLSSHVTFPIIYNGIDTESFKVKESLPSTPIVFGNCSRLTKQKGFHHLIDAVEKVKHRPFKVLIAGDGELKEELESLVKEKGLEEKIEFKGHLESPQSFYHEIDVLTFTSAFEGTARTILEAWATGLPVVSFDVSSMSDMITDGENGVLIKPYEIEDYAFTMELLIDQFHRYKDMGTKGREKVERDHNKVIQYQKWYNYLTSL